MICESCFYHSLYTGTCDYILIEDRMRGCPAGDGCMKYISANERERENKAFRNYEDTIAKREKQLRRIEGIKKVTKLYDAGKTDAEIAAETNTETSLIAIWREKKGLKENPGYSDSIMRYYLQGLSDREIAGKIGIKPKDIYKWRMEKN